MKEYQRIRPVIVDEKLNKTLTEENEELKNEVIQIIDYVTPKFEFKENVCEDVVVKISKIFDNQRKLYENLETEKYGETFQIDDERINKINKKVQHFSVKDLNKIKTKKYWKDYYKEIDRLEAEKLRDLLNQVTQDDEWKEKMVKLYREENEKNGKNNLEELNIEFKM